MQKVQNASKIVFFILLLSINNSIFSQKILEGRFVDNTDWYEFNDDNTFDYINSEGLNIGRYGKGHYIFTKDSLIFNFDLTNIRYAGYYIIKPYLNLKDSIQIDITVYDIDKNVLPNTQVFIPKGIWIETLTDNRGKAQLNIKKKDIFNDLVIINNNENAMFVIRDINLFFSYEIEVFLTKDFSEMTMGIKNTIQKYKIVKCKKDYLELQQANGDILKLEKVEKGFYDDDPFK